MYATSSVGTAALILCRILSTLCEIFNKKEWMFKHISTLQSKTWNKIKKQLYAITIWFSAQSVEVPVLKIFSNRLWTIIYESELLAFNYSYSEWHCSTRVLQYKANFKTPRDNYASGIMDQGNCQGFLTNCFI